MFLDNTACNLASLNLLKFYDAENRSFDVDGYEHAIRLWTIVLEISVLMAAYPSKEIAEQSWRYRTLGLGYANLGAMLMQAGIPYDSDEARAVCRRPHRDPDGSLVRGQRRAGRELGAVPGTSRNRDDDAAGDPQPPARRPRRRPRLRRVRGAARIRPVPIDHDLFRIGRHHPRQRRRCLLAGRRGLGRRARSASSSATATPRSTVIAPTGTIGLLMDCDTTGVEPDFALTKFKKLAGGGYFKIANQSVRPALRTLGYDRTQIDDIVTYVMGTLSLDMPEGDGGPANVPRVPDRA